MASRSRVNKILDRIYFAWMNTERGGKPDYFKRLWREWQDLKGEEFNA